MGKTVLVKCSKSDECKCDCVHRAKHSPMLNEDCEPTNCTEVECSEGGICS